MFAKCTIRQLSGMGLLVAAVALGFGQIAQAQLIRLNGSAPQIATVYRDTEWMEVRWTDNTTNESQFQISYRLQGATTWISGDIVPANHTVSLLPKPESTGTYEFRVTAQIVAGGRVWAQLSSRTLAREIRAERIAPPSNFRAIVLNYDGSVLTRWVDNSDDEYGFIVQYRQLGECGWHDFVSLPPDTTKAYVQLPYYNHWELRVVAEADFTYYEIHERSAGSNSVCVDAGPMEG